MDLSSKITSLRATIFSWSISLFNYINIIYIWASKSKALSPIHVPQFLESHSDWSLYMRSHLLLCLVWTSWLRVLYHPHLDFVPCTHGHMFRRRWIRGCCTLKEQNDGLHPVWHDTVALGHVVVRWSAIRPASLHQGKVKARRHMIKDLLSSCDDEAGITMRPQFLTGPSAAVVIAPLYLKDYTTVVSHSLKLALDLGYIQLYCLSWVILRLRLFT